LPGFLCSGAAPAGSALTRLECLVLLISPATLVNLQVGQTGSLFAGLMLLALSARSHTDPVPPFAAALLTIKPQAGFLLPLLWAVERRWLTIILAGALFFALVGLSLLLFGPQAFFDWVGQTLPVLSQLERQGSGPFVETIPSLFMALRVLGLDGDRALLIHFGFAALVCGFLAWKLFRVDHAQRRAAMVLVAGALMTPYLHYYDLALLLAGALLVFRYGPAGKVSPLLRAAFVIVAWAMPLLVMGLNRAGLPLSPLLMLPLLVFA
jgi:alpha-1,2-mannosyltransferase